MRVATLVLLLAATGCGGQEDVLLMASRADASLGDASGDGATSDAKAVGDGGVRTDSDAQSTACALPPGRLCRENGGACVLDVECCSLRCASGVCLEPGTCAGPGAACASRSDCCGGRCEPVLGTATRACLGYCKVDGAACARALDCCSMACNGGVCGGAICVTEGEVCASNAACCSGVCSTVDGKCALDPAAACRATGDKCESTSPCCVACGTTNERCDFGAGACRPIGAICGQDTDCCRGTCVQGDGGTYTCAAACLADGAACTSGADCCAGRCSGSPGTCGAPAKECVLIGSTCASSGDCCSSQCIEGACGSNCAPR